MKKIFLMQNTSDDYKYNAGSKARNDIFSIISRDADTRYVFLYKEGSKAKKLWTYLTNLFKISSIENTQSLFIAEHPLMGLKASLFLKYLKKIGQKKAEIVKVGVIHDLEALRYHPDEMKSELSLLNHFDYLISHNKKMSHWLRSNGITARIIDLELFDYLLDVNREIIMHNYQPDHLCIAYAGNLAHEKSDFLYKLSKIKDSHLYYSLYGAHFDEDAIANRNQIRYYGKKDPEELPFCMDADYGLIWDGQELETCTGMMGNYLKYNNPHKLSLYIASGLPVIVWRKSAAADFVRDHEIGFCLDSLYELNQLNQVNAETYQKMKNNVNQLRSKCICGHYFKQAITHIQNDVLHEACHQAELKER